MHLEQILAIDPKAEWLRESLLVLMPYAVEVRYPDDTWMPEKSDAMEARRSAQEIYDWLRSMHSELFD